MQVALYARVSTPTQEKADTIESQLEQLQAYARQQAYDVLPEHIFLDNGVSGARLDRPELDRLRDCVQMGDVDAILILSPDRLARNYVSAVVALGGVQKMELSDDFCKHPLFRHATGSFAPPGAGHDC